MTENKRYTSDIHRIYDDNEEIACADTMDDAEVIVDLLNEQDADLMMQREKALYWRNKAEDIFGDMQTNVELKKENIKLKERIKKLKLELNSHKHPLWSTRQCQERIRELEKENAELLNSIVSLRAINDELRGIDG